MTTTYDLRIQIVEFVDHEGEACDYCQQEGHVVQAQAYLSLGEAADVRRHMISTCLPCLVPAIDSTPYLIEDRMITVEVARSATARPF